MKISLLSLSDNVKDNNGWLSLLAMLTILYLSLLINIPIEILSAVIILATVYSSLCFFGKKTTGMLMIICFIIGAVAEMSSLYTGFPFGFYNYTSVLQPQLYGLPIFIPLLWFSLTFIAMLAFNTIIPFAMLLFDFMLDPVWSKVLWVWSKTEGEPLLLNIPLTNFLGWFIVSSAMVFFIRKYAIKSGDKEIVSRNGFIIFALFTLNIFFKLMITQAGLSVI